MFGKAVTFPRVFGFRERVDANWLVILALVIQSPAGGAFWFGLVNGLLAIFSLIPGLPPEGRRVLTSIPCDFKCSLARATAIAAKAGSAPGLLLTGPCVVSIS